MFRVNIIIKFFNMKKQFLNLGKALNKAEQKQIFGGNNDLEVEEGMCSNQCGYTMGQEWGCPAGQSCFTGYCDGAETRMCRR